jgi:hypothetical protein
MWPGTDLIDEPFKPECLNYKLKLGSHGVIFFANYSLNALIARVHPPPDMQIHCRLLLSNPVSPIFQRTDSCKGNLFYVKLSINCWYKRSHFFTKTNKFF